MEILNMVGIGVISLFIYIFVIIIVNVIFKRKMAEAMLWAVIVLVFIGGLTGKDPLFLLKDGITFAFKQETLFASVAFVFMAYLMSATGVIGRLVTILNSILGRLAGGPAYVSSIASALFGMVSGSGSGNASAVGSITIPWMEETGWSKESAATIVAGNAGLGIAFPPSSSMFLLLGMPAIAAELTSGTLYMTLLNGALLLLAARLLVVFYYTRKYKIKAVPSEQRLPLSRSVKENGTSLTIFLGILIPILITMGPFNGHLKAMAWFGEEAVKSISMLVWIPVLMSVIVAIEGRDKLPKNIKGWWKFIETSISKYSEVGMLLFAAFVASRILIKLGLESEITAIMETLGDYSPVMVVAVIAILISMMVGPFSGTATTTAIGSVAYIAFRSIGVEPAVSCTAFLLMASNEGCIPPSSAPVYIAAGIASVEKPGVIFKNTVLHFALPAIIIGVLIALGMIPLL